MLFLRNENINKYANYPKMNFLMKNKLLNWLLMLKRNRLQLKKNRKKHQLRKNQMCNCISIEQFYRCIKNYMKHLRGISDINKIQKAHCVAVRKCSKEILDMKGEG